MTAHGMTGQKTGTGTNDNDVVISLDQNAEAYDTFLLMSTAGAMDVFVTLDGTNYSTAALSLADLGATSTDPVVVTAANRVYGFRGKYRGIRVLQNGATGVANATLRYGVM
jgi:hypothetical protein